MKLSSDELPRLSASAPVVTDTLRVEEQRKRRRLVYVMVLRVVLFSLLLAGTVALHALWGSAEDLAGAHVTTLFICISAVYLASIFYALVFRTKLTIRPLAIAQIVVDLILASVIVHLTGSAESAFVLLFFLTPIGAALTLEGRAALYTGAVSMIVFIATVLLGYFGVLPTLPGQLELPWQLPASTIGRSLFISCGAMVAVASLADYLVGQIRTVTTHADAIEARIGDISALYADVVRCLASGLLTVDSDGLVTTLNAAAADLLGVHESETLNKPLKEISDDLAQMAASREAIRRAEITIVTQSTKKILGVSVSSLSSRAGVEIGKIINFQDLSALRELEEREQRSMQLTALGRVAAGVAHEIRNPLASISGSLELLRADTEGNGDDLRLMDIALREIGRLDRLIDDLLRYARPQQTQSLEALDLGYEIDLMISCINSLMAANDNAPEVIISHTESDLWIAADHDQVRGMLWNLVRNAWQAGEHETITISLTPLANESGPSTQIALSVRDHGRGIPAEDLANIFEPFFTTRDQGSGLGLSVVHRTMQDHDGTITIESTPNQGTTVSLIFPRVTRPEPDDSQP